MMDGERRDAEERRLREDRRFRHERREFDGITSNVDWDRRSGQDRRLAPHPTQDRRSESDRRVN